MKTLLNPLVRRRIRLAPARKIDAYIEIVGSTNPRLNAMARDSQLTMLAILSQQYTKVAISHVNTMADLEVLAGKKPDLVVLGMKLVLLEPSLSYDDSPKMWLSDYLEAAGISFTGSDTTALMLEFDKHAAKQQVIDSGLHSASYFISQIIQPTLAHNLTFPLFVKPTNRGDSKGIDELSVVHNETELASKVRSIHTDYSSDALIEEYLPGREFSVAVIKQPDSEELLAMPIEITSPVDAKGNRFLSEAVKEADSETVLAVADQALKDALNSLAIGVFKALGSRDYGRIDMRLSADGTPHFIEANLMPGLSDHGYLVRCFTLNNQISYSDMILSIVRLALERKPALI
jgi:D-alanine-D-alanine ligase